MRKRLKIGIVGCGAIGSSLAEAVVKDFSREAKLTSLYDTDKSKASELVKKLDAKVKICQSLGSLIRNSHLVVEAARAQDSFTITKKCLRNGRDVVVLSVGGIVAGVNQIRVLAKKNNAKVYIPSGAICGIDGLKGVSLGKIRKVTLRTLKNPKSLRNIKYIQNQGINLASIKKDTVLFSGSAQLATRYFPKNINVAATLSIAGIGPRKTQVKIIACPKTKKNIHEIQIDSDIAKISTRVENMLHPKNPKTSYLAVLAAIVTLRQILEPVRVGT